MTRFRVLVVDDEPLAREIVVNLLRRDTEIALVTEASDPGPVPAIVSSERPEIVFLDIEMPGLSGLQIASTLPGLTSDLPVVVFVTAFSEYALEAFECGATDYLLKPFTDERFFSALERAKQRVRERRTAATTTPRGALRAQPFLQRLVVGTGDRASVIELADVRWIEAEDYYVRLHSKTGRHLLRASMASLEQRLDPAHFVRAHRAAIVNIREVTAVDGASLRLSDGTAVPISRSKRPQVAQIVAARPYLARPL